MIVSVTPGRISGSMAAPASKSSMQRALAAALIRRGETLIHGPGTSDDDRAALENVQRLGAKVNWESDGALRILSRGVDPVEDTIHCGESGLGIRMFTPIAALSDRELTVTGSGSLAGRPMDLFDRVFPALGVSIRSHGGRLPLVIQGPLRPADIDVDGSLSSQFLTGLLMAFAAAGAKGVTIRVQDLRSKPYIDLTLKVLADFGWTVENRSYREFYFPGGVPYAGRLDHTVEGDWSGAAFLLVAGALSLSKSRLSKSRLLESERAGFTVTGLDLQSTQADKAVLQAMTAAGVEMSLQDNEIAMKPCDLKGFRFDATECPDLFPPLVALAAFCPGTTVISGATRLTHKESDRALTLQEEFGKLGVKIDLQDDLMVIHGGHGVKGTEVHSHHDHRIAMALAVAGLFAEGETVIGEAGAISKSYPDFYDDMRSLGAIIK